ncbi:MAG: HAD hydrolase-like protein [Bacteroidales bacterium]|nr:HAD hydrolase-like protein [Bacteroidales bacterium]
MKEGKNTILWDWNGTLLNDAEICLEGINILLQRRDLPVLDMTRYREIFTFPVRDYYKAAGIDFGHEPFEIPAEEFIVQFKRLLPRAGLFGDVMETLHYFQQKGFRQYIVSAMEQNALRQSVAQREIAGFFHSIYGIENNLADSKIQRAKELIEKQKIDVNKTVMIGDTLHDGEVAKELGIEIIFISRGHQNAERLSQNGNLLFPDLKSLIKFMI